MDAKDPILMLNDGSRFKRAFLSEGWHTSHLIYSHKLNYFSKC